MSRTTTEVAKRDYSDRQNIVDLPPIEQAAGGAWSWKEDGVALDDEFDISPRTEFWRKGQMVGAATVSAVDKEHGLAMANHLAVIMDADYITFSVDAHVANEMTNPKTGKAWAQGEMQSYCNDDDGCSTGVITDCIITMGVSPDGTAETVQRTYHIDHTSKKVHWIADDYMIAGGENALAGYVPDRLRSSWDTPVKPLIDLLTPTEEDGSDADKVDPEMVRWATAAMMAVTAILVLPLSTVLFTDVPEMGIQTIVNILEPGLMSNLAGKLKITAPELRRRWGVTVPEEMDALDCNMAVTMFSPDSLCFMSVTDESLAYLEKHQSDSSDLPV